MKKFILGKKQDMMQLYSPNGDSVAVTVVVAEPCIITQIKTIEKDQYNAIQVGSGSRKLKHLAKPQQGHLKGLANVAVMREYRVTDPTQYKRGDKITVAQFVEGEKVKISGVSKGKGFQGVVRRHHFSGSPASHGHKDQLRMPGSIGATEPQHVFKGMRMAGHMGDDHCTITNVTVFKVDEKNNKLFLTGAVPGARNALVEIYV